jgi:hypothetical protein
MLLVPVFLLALPPGDNVRRSSTSLLACIGLAFASACDSGPDLVGVDLPVAVPIPVMPVFAVAPRPQDLAVLDLLRITLRSPIDGSVVKTEEISINPDDEEWSIEMTVDVPASQRRTFQFYLETELADTDGGVESVGWSGRTQAFRLQSPDRPLEFRQVTLHRGPLANLGLTGVAFSLTSLDLVEGATSALRWFAQGDTAGTVLYFGTEDEGVVQVDSLGVLHTQGPGSTQVFVYGGRVEDSLTVEVAEIFLPAPAEVVSTIQPQLDYVTSDLFVSTFEDATQAEAIRTRILEVAAALQVRDGPGVVAAFELVKVAWKAYGAGTQLRYTDGPELGVLELTLMRVANALHTAFP